MLYVVPVKSILGKLPMVPVGDFGTVSYGMRAQFTERSQTAHQAAETAVGCGMLTHGRWAGTARREQDEAAG